MSFDNEKNKNYFIIVIIFIIICIYGVFSIYFIKHFYFGTYINEINVSCKTVKEANELLLKESYNYTIKLEERNDVTEYIKGSNINFEYKGSKETEEIKTSQNPFLWIVNIFSNNKYIINEVYSFDRNLLKEELEKLNCFNSEDIVEPIDACLKYEDGEFKIIKEVYGNKINEEFLYAYLLNSILLGERCINLDEINAYENPKFTSESEKVIKAQNELNKYVSSEIYYIFDNEIEVLDSSIINTWLEVDSTMNVVINEEKIKEYIKTLGIKYDTYGKTRSFKSTTGKNINVPGGNYGWRIDRTKEKEAIIENIKSGEIIKKEPIYLQTALGNHENDIGNTYVEINLTNQYLWFYKSGKIITQGDVVTGNVSRGNATPQGTYTLNYKQKNATLRGDNYNSDVKYWMPFNMNIGIHDASWRNSFGGNIYQTSGSHGCVNAPEYLAKKIFENIRFPVGKLHEDEFTTHLAFYNARKLVYIDVSKYNYDRTREESITASFREKNLDVIDALQSRLDFFYEKGIVELQTEMENMYFCVLLDRLYKCYLYGIKTDRVRKIIYDTNEKYFLNMELPLNPNYKYELSMLKISYNVFILCRKYKWFNKLVRKMRFIMYGNVCN